MEQVSGLKARQIKAARALLDWSQEDLASASGLSVATIRKLELGNISPRGKTTDSIRSAFENAGLEFLDPDGVRHRPEEISVHEGEDGVKKFLDEVYQSSFKGAEIVQVWPSSQHFIKVMGSHRSKHIARMEAIREQINMKCIMTENPEIISYNYCDYRYLSRHYVDSVPFYVYGDKYAVVAFASNDDPKIIVIQSRSASEAFRRQFYSMWEKATPIGTESTRRQSSAAVKQ